MNTKTIYKWDIDTETLPCDRVIDVPERTKFISASMQYDKLVIWGIVDPDEGRYQLRRIQLRGTGRDLGPKIGEFLATVQKLPNFIIHIFLPAETT